jgi:predicted GNAT superfamily acetyltransferase
MILILNLIFIKLKLLDKNKFIISKQILKNSYTTLFSSNYSFTDYLFHANQFAYVLRETKNKFIYKENILGLLFY